MKNIFIFPIRLYQYFISPLLGKNCRHVPSCSQFMIESITEWGVLKGTWMGMKRIGRCHPWGTFGYDPVPRKVAPIKKRPSGSVDLEETSEVHLQFEKRGGLIPVVVQESSTGQVLMLGYANSKAVETTINSGLATFWSTSRQQIWTKGKTSGNYLKVDRILVDCDQDALAYMVTLGNGGVCHTFSSSGEHRKACFYREFKGDGKLEFLPEMK